MAVLPSVTKQTIPPGLGSAVPGVATTPAPSKVIVKNIRAPKVQRGDEDTRDGLKLLFFGPWGSGKTFQIISLLEMGLRVYVITSDLMGSGLSTVKLALRRKGKEALLKNLFEICLEGREQVNAFLENPLTYDPEFYTREADVLFWDGYSMFQQSDVTEYIGDNVKLRTDKDGLEMQGQELRGEGLQLDVLDWNAVKAATISSLKKFGRLKSGKVLADGTAAPFHKVLTCQEKVRAKPKEEKTSNGQPNPLAGAEYVDEHMPALSGQGGALAGSGFDLIIRTAVKTSGKEVYAKNRGFQIEGDVEAARNFTYVVSASGKEIVADPEKLWRSLLTQAGYQVPGENSTQTLAV